MRLAIIKEVIKDKYLRTIFAISALLLLIVFTLICFKFIGIRNPIIVHFDVYKGIDFLGSRIDVFGIFLAAVVIFLINLFLSNHLFYRERFLSYVFAATTLFLVVLALIAIAAIISVN
ncbi:MAG: hypothetical protein WC297_00995 [Candidatus Paceibacterota bacterium]|jgi:hypothetical protein